MFDIHFYRKSFEIKQKLKQGIVDGRDVYLQFASLRSQEPFVFNIETTNICNMQCRMCPAPLKMTRPRVTMESGMFERVVDQLRPWTVSEWEQWEDFAERSYGVPRRGMDENHFFLYVIPRVIVLHGYGEPLLDPLIVERVNALSRKGIPSYFSCNPWNITFDLGQRLFDAGLDYLKFSTDSADDISIKQIRGQRASFSEAYEKITGLVKLRDKNHYATNLVITMLNLNRPNQKVEYEKLCKKFDGVEVYLYLKSTDQQWYQKIKAKTQSIHWLEPCQFPWSSMTIKSDGSVTPCVEDFNNETVIGEVGDTSLRDIWNGKPYQRFREAQLSMEPNVKCTRECDMRLVGESYGVRRPSLSASVALEGEGGDGEK